MLTALGGRSYYWLQTKIFNTTLTSSCHANYDFSNKYCWSSSIITAGFKPLTSSCVLSIIIFRTVIHYFWNFTKLSAYSIQKLPAHTIFWPALNKFNFWTDKRKIVNFVSFFCIGKISQKFIELILKLKYRSWLWNFETIMQAAPNAGHTLNYTTRKPLVNGVARLVIQFFKSLITAVCKICPNYCCNIILLKHIQTMLPAMGGSVS